MCMQKRTHTHIYIYIFIYIYIHAFLRFRLALKALNGAAHRWAWGDKHILGDIMYAGVYLSHIFFREKCTWQTASSQGNALTSLVASQTRCHQCERTPELVVNRMVVSNRIATKITWKPGTMRETSSNYHPGNNVLHPFLFFGTSKFCKLFEDSTSQWVRRTIWPIQLFPLTLHKSLVLSLKGTGNESKNKTNTYILYI